MKSKYLKSASSADSLNMVDEITETSGPSVNSAPVKEFQ